MLKEVFGKIISSPSKTFLAFCFCFIIGAGSASLLDTKAFFNPVLIIFFIAAVLTILTWSYRSIRFLVVGIVILMVGMLRSLMIIPDDSPSVIQHYEGQKVTFRGTIVEEPDIRIDKAYYVIKTNLVSNLPTKTGAKRTSKSGGKSASLEARTRDSSTASGAAKTLFAQDDKNEVTVSGRVLVKYQIYPELRYGDEVEVHCKLQQPERTEEGTFRYDKYLARQDIWVFCSNAGITKVADGKGNPVRAYLLHFKYLVAHQLEKLWPEPENSFMAGILYGSKAGLPERIMDNLSKTGVTHIIAVSGSNISIIAVNLMAVCIAVGLYRRKAFWVMCVLIILFVIFTGASASVVRAGIMGIIALVAERVGRASRMTNVLVATAALMTLLNPYVLVWDAGFQLSFLATIGLVYISPLLKGYAEKIKIPALVETRFIASLPLVGKIFEVAKENLITTLAAIIATLPLILYQFGRLSTVAPLVNILILWIIPYLMLFGFLALLVSVIYFPLGQIFAGVAKLGMDYILWLVNFFGTLSWSAVDIRIPLWMMMVLYMLMFIGVNKIRLRLKTN